MTKVQQNLINLELLCLQFTRGNKRQRATGHCWHTAEQQQNQCGHLRYQWSVKRACNTQARFPFKRKRLRFLRFSFTQLTQCKWLRLDGNRASDKIFHPNANAYHKTSTVALTPFLSHLVIFSTMVFRSQCKLMWILWTVIYLIYAKTHSGK